MPITSVEPHRRTRLFPTGHEVGLPPLESGDCLTREEFERRYEAMPHLKKAELIEGRVYMPAAVRKDHGAAHSDMITWLGNYRAGTPGVKLYDNTTVRLGANNESQPDALLRIESCIPEPSWMNEGDYIEHPPELVVEVAGSSASYDLHEKLNVYLENGIQEYVVWQIYENHLDWFHRVEGQYVALLPDEAGILRSRVFPGLQLDLDSLLAGDMAEVLTVLQRGVQSEEHAAFVRQVNEKNRG